MKTVFGLNLQTILRWILGLMFLWASLSKLPNLQEFYLSVNAYRLPLPDTFLRAVVITLPWLELLCGLMLLVRFRVKAALVWAIILFTVFALVTGQAWVRGLNIGCGCFHLDLPFLEGERKIAFAHFMESPAFAFCRALLLLAATLWLFRTSSSTTDVASPSQAAEEQK